MGKRTCRRKHYAAGATFSVGALLKEVLGKQLTSEEGMQLLVCFALTVSTMREDKDTIPPFLTRAMAKSLEKIGLEDYESAYNRILERTEAEKQK